jgi:hypothetical protein
MLAIANQLDVYVSLEAYQEANKAGIPMVNSPVTNLPICGAIAFGLDDSHANVTDYTIA